jgi:hypothetical protein
MAFHPPDKSKLLPLDARGLNGHDQFPGRQTLIAASAEKPSGEVEIARAGAKLVGVPYGSELYIETYLRQRLAKTQELLTEIAKMGSVQDQLLLLRACAHPRAAYWNRLLPPDYLSTLSRTSSWPSTTTLCWTACVLCLEWTD